MKRLRRHYDQHAPRVMILADQAVVSGSNFLLSILLARTLGLDGYGTFALGWMAVLFAASFQLAFMVSPLYALMGRQADQGGYAASLLRLQCFITLLTGLVVAGGSVAATHSGLVDIPLRMAIMIAVVSMAHVHLDLLRRCLIALGRTQRTLLLDLVAYGGQLIAIRTSMELGSPSVTQAFGLIALAMGVPAVVAHILLLRALPPPMALRTVARWHWEQGKHLVGSMVLQWSSGNLFIASAGALLGPAAVGVLRMSQNLVGLLHVLFLALENRVPLRAAAIQHLHGRSAMLRYISRTARLAALPTAFVLLVLALFSRQLLELVYGETGRDGAWVLPAFAGLYVLIFLGTFLRFTIRTLERNKVILLSYVVTTAFSVLAAGPMVARYGLGGVMAGLFIVHALNLTLYLVAIRSHMPWAYK
jgi:O-antigen/teichoic acid export membrane protein